MAPLIQLIVVLLVLGVILYLIETLIPMDPAFKMAIRVVVLLILILWLLSFVGLLPGGPWRVTRLDGHARAAYTCARSGESPPLIGARARWTGGRESAPGRPDTARGGC